MTDLSQNTTFAFPILVVDDNLLLRTMLEANLKAAGYKVVTAENGKQALEIFKKDYYPIVMTDWVMPEMDGLDLCRAIRTDDSGRYTYVILLTSQNSKNDIITGLEAGADEYLIKPVHQAELVTRLKTARRILELESSLKTSMEEIKSLSLIDPLTGIFNRRYMNDRIPHEIKKAYRYERSLSLILVGINQFKEVTDTYGHFTGDLVLKACADCMAESARKELDWLARYGEDEFVVVLPETDAAGAVILAKRLRIRIASTVIKNNNKELKVTASFGVAGFTASKEKEGLTAQILLDKADGCLHQAKDDGGESIKGVQLS
ncbi:MAG: response regulator/GGDEF domain-containing [Geobacteraceae bacterium]|nr:MAG: response regulator/GGDEF domain-containing [Geobacteraceae bacterium]